jgi:hypothetical protein
MIEFSELFDRDPLSLSDQDIAKIIARMREAQAQYELGAKAPVAARSKKPTKSENLLKDLGLT